MSPEDVGRASVEIAGVEISFETGKLAKQAGGAVVARAGDTMVLCTATAGNPRDVDFLPLTVDVEERMYAAGKIPGSFFKREGRPSEKGILTARMIDRPIRPLFPKGWTFETQVVATPMCVDHVVPYDILAMNGASAALNLSDIPFPTQVGAVRIGKLEGKFVVNPEEATIPESELDLIVAGTDDAILMVEAGANEITEGELLDALDIAHEEIRKLCAAQRELAERFGKAKKEITPIVVDEGLLEQIRASHGEQLDQATQVEDKLARQDATKAVEEEILAKYAVLDDEAADAVDPARRAAVQRAFDKLEKDIIRRRIAVDKRRPDGRAADEIREVTAEVGIAPRTHGSALFTRGQTQAYTVATLGTSREEQRLDTLGLETAKRYFHHYNFPPFSVGEAGFMRGPKRRDIGHGALAERALLPMIPDPGGVPVHDPGRLRHPRVERLVVDGLGLRLDALADGRGREDPQAGRGHRDGARQGGRRLHRPLRHRGRRGPPGRHGLQGRRHGERHHGAPDGHQDLGRHVRHPSHALEQAREGRTFILGKMADAIAETRAELSPFAPRITSIQIDPDMIGKVIGKGGETIRALSDEYEAQIDVDDEGMVLVYAVNGEQGDACVEAIRQMTKDVELGEIFTGKVVKTTTFGAFVELSKGTDGLIHISNIKPGERPESVEDVVNKGDELTVRVVELDKARGRHRPAACGRPRDRGQVGRGALGDRAPATAGRPEAEVAATAIATAAAADGRGGRDRDRSGSRRD